MKVAEHATEGAKLWQIQKYIIRQKHGVSLSNALETLVDGVAKR